MEPGTNLNAYLCIQNLYGKMAVLKNDHFDFVKNGRFEVISDENVLEYLNFEF